MCVEVVIQNDPLVESDEFFTITAASPDTDIIRFQIFEIVDIINDDGEH